MGAWTEVYGSCVERKVCACGRGMGYALLGSLTFYFLAFVVFVTCGMYGATLFPSEAFSVLIS